MFKIGERVQFIDEAKHKQYGVLVVDIVTGEYVTCKVGNANPYYASEAKTIHYTELKKEEENQPIT